MGFHSKMLIAFTIGIRIQCASNRDPRNESLVHGNNNENMGEQ